MPNINANYRTLRINLRKHGIDISEDAFTRFHPATMDVGDEICIFCKSTLNLTKEHVIPKWLFEKNVKSTFVSSVNRQTQSYNKAVVPACSNCNNTILAEIEKHIVRIIGDMDRGSKLNIGDYSDIIRWLEILEYKLQVYDCRRKYIKYANSQYDTSWGTLPLSVMRHFMDFNPFLVLKYLRRAQRRITVKSKNDRLLSLVIFHTTKAHFNFFTQPDEYIYISFPMYNIAVFYFLREKFYDNREAYEEALYYIDGVSKS